MKHIKRFENLDNDNMFSIYDFKNHLLYCYRGDEIIDLDLIKKYTDQFVGVGFYEKIYKHSTYLYNSLKKTINNLDILEGLLENRFDSVIYGGDELKMWSGVSYYSSVEKEEYNGVRFYIKNLRKDTTL